MKNIMEKYFHFAADTKIKTRRREMNLMRSALQLKFVLLSQN